VRRFLGTTRGRLVTFAVAILGVSLLLADGGILVSLALTNARESDAVLVSQANVLAAGIEDKDGQLSFGSGELPGETQGGVAVDAAIVSATGAITQTPAQPLSTTYLSSVARQAQKAGGPVWADVTDLRGSPRRVYAIPLGGGGGSAALVVSRSVREQQATLARTVVLLGLFSAAIVVVGGLLAYWMAGRVLRPVSTIASLARSLGERDLHRRVDVKVPDDELGELVATFNDMLARLEAAFDSLRRFTADASHELRAPLALMLNELEGSLAKATTNEEYRRALDTQLTEVEHLARLADQLLILARADAGALRPAPEAVDVADFLHETAARWAAAAELRGRRVDVAAPDSGYVMADPSLFRRVLDNLVDNALRYAPEGTGVMLRAYPANSGWNFEVSDQGPGVPVEYRDRLFQRFARPDGARTRGTGGAGLGLALSAAIVRAHGGQLKLSDDRSGAVFELHLPRRPQIGTENGTTRPAPDRGPL
jgi:heavy metal sensor kinase